MKGRLSFDQRHRFKFRNACGAFFPEQTFRCRSLQYFKRLRSEVCARAEFFHKECAGFNSTAVYGDIKIGTVYALEFSRLADDNLLLKILLSGKRRLYICGIE